MDYKMRIEEFVGAQSTGTGKENCLISSIEIKHLGMGHSEGDNKTGGC